MRKFFHRLLGLRELPVAARYAISAVVVLLALGIREAMGGLVAEAPFLLFFPAVILSAVLFDHGTGIFSTVLSTALIAWFDGIRPDLAGAMPGDLVPLALFLVIGAAIATLIEALHRSYHDLAVSHLALSSAYEQLGRAEREKDLLLRELSHRTQNHLQTVASLLQLQAKRSTDPDGRAALLTSAGRVQVIGRLHGRLTRADGHVYVDTAAFINELCDDLRLSLIGTRPLLLIVEAASAPMRLARAVPVGLIINELVTNALKYAFPDDHGGRVEVRFARNGAAYRLSVIDDGIGIADASDESAGLGRQLVRALTRQLDGKLEVDMPGSGTRCAITFPVGDG